jgi:ATP-dependent RNA helicase DeaD
MGFIDDVEWILEQTPKQRQVALFSATMPKVIHRIATQHLKNPVEVAIEVQTVINKSIRQRVWMMAGVHKLDALTRILEVEDFDAVIMFVRTRIATTELAEKLAARGYAAAALNGDIPQNQREATIDRLKAGKIDILVATDVAARGLDVERVSHVINYDIPYDVEAYVHRIGRTGRAGRHGDAILFAANRERRLLRAIEKATGEPIEKMQLPSVEELTDKRMARFKERITETLDTAELDLYRKVVAEYQSEYGVPVIDIAAALGALAQGAKPLAAETRAKSETQRPAGDKDRGKAGKKDKRFEEETRKPRREKEPSQEKRRASASANEQVAKGMERYRIEVGHEHGVKPANIVGAIANEAEIDAEYIGRIDIFEDHSTVDLPEGMPKEILKHLQTVWVSGQRLKARRMQESSPKRHKRKKPAGKGKRSEAPKKQPR